MQAILGAHSTEHLRSGAANVEADHADYMHLETCRSLVREMKEEYEAEIARRERDNVPEVITLSQAALLCRVYESEVLELVGLELLTPIGQSGDGPLFAPREVERLWAHHRRAGLREILEERRLR
jgi:hypothetical protein